MDVAKLLHSSDLNGQTLTKELAMAKAKAVAKTGTKASKKSAGKRERRFLDYRLGQSNLVGHASQPAVQCYENATA